MPLTLSSQCPSLPDSAALCQQAGPPRVKPSGPRHDEADCQPGGSRSQAAGWAWGGDTGGGCPAKAKKVEPGRNIEDKDEDEDEEDKEEEETSGKLPAQEPLGC